MDLMRWFFPSASTNRTSSLPTMKSTKVYHHRNRLPTMISTKVYQHQQRVIFTTSVWNDDTDRLSSEFQLLRVSLSGNRLCFFPSAAANSFLLLLSMSCNSSSFYCELPRISLAGNRLCFRQHGRQIFLLSSSSAD